MRIKVMFLDLAVVSTSDINTGKSLFLRRTKSLDLFEIMIVPVI